jgi:hypothetical protein
LVIRATLKGLTSTKPEKDPRLCVAERNLATTKDIKKEPQGVDERIEKRKGHKKISCLFIKMLFVR